MIVYVLYLFSLQVLESEQFSLMLDVQLLHDMLGITRSELPVSIVNLIKFFFSPYNKLILYSKSL